MADTLKVIAGPAYLLAGATNIYTPPAATIYTTIRHIHVANVTSGAATFNLYRGLTGGSAGGTELFSGQTVLGNNVYDYWCNLKMLSTDFLSGLASALTTLVITVEGTQTVV